MTARPQQDERDPLPEPDWKPVSSAWARRQALEAAAAAVTAAKEARKKPEGGGGVSHERRADAYVPPRYPVDEPPTYRAQCGCGWIGPERYRGITDVDWRAHIEGADL